MIYIMPIKRNVFYCLYLKHHFIYKIFKKAQYTTEATEGSGFSRFFAPCYIRFIMHTLYIRIFFSIDLRNRPNDLTCNTYDPCTNYINPNGTR